MIKRLLNGQTVSLFIFIFYLPPSISFVKNITEFIANTIKILSKNNTELNTVTITKKKHRRHKKK